MSIKEGLSGIGKVLEGDAQDAAYRLAGKQFVKMTREPLIAFLAGHLGPNDPTMRAKVAAFLETDLGKSILEGFLAMGLSMVPVQVGEVPQKLARELRVQAMTDVGDVVADLLMGPLRQVISDMLRGEQTLTLPAESATVVKFPQAVEASITEPVEAKAKLG